MVSEYRWIGIKEGEDGGWGNNELLTTVASGHQRSRDAEDNKQPMARIKGRVSSVGMEGNKEMASQDLG